MKKNKYKKNSGFTLVETILYLAIVAVLLTAVIDFHLTLGGTASKLGQNINVSRNRRTSLSAIDYLIRNSDGFLKDVYNNCSDFDASPPVLALYFEDDDHLPGICVQNGGAVRVTLDNQRVAMTCYPNIINNGTYQACDTSVYTAVTTTYLTSPNVRVANTNFSFATSTATSSLNAFTSVTTHMKVASLSSGQINLAATSTATSTVVVRNEQPDGLVTFWTFEDADTTPDDYAGDNDGTCDADATPVPPGLVGGSTYSMDMELSDSVYCRPNSPSNPNNLNFGDEFTLTAWIQPESITLDDHSIFRKSSYGDSQGYHFVVDDDGALRCRIYDYAGSTYKDTKTSAGIITVGDTFHVACVYDYNIGEVNVFAYEKGTGGVATATSDTDVPILVNYNNNPYISISNYFDGEMDDVRWYNRAITDSELWALQSQAGD